MSYQVWVLLPSGINSVFNLLLIDEQITTSGSVVPDAHDYIEIETLSMKPWLVTGGNVLLEVRGNPVLNKLLNYSINGQDVSSLF